jgi:hypothetical protein
VTRWTRRFFKARTLAIPILESYRPEDPDSLALRSYPEMLM